MKTEGLTLLEVLAGIVLMAILILLTAQPLLFSLSSNTTSDRTMTATKVAQDVLEDARAQVVNNYTSPIFASITLPSGTTLQCQDVAVDGTVAANCAATADATTPYLRRLTVKSTVTNMPDVVLTLDVRP